MSRPGPVERLLRLPFTEQPAAAQDLIRRTPATALAALDEDQRLQLLQTALSTDCDDRRALAARIFTASPLPTAIAVPAVAAAKGFADWLVAEHCIGRLRRDWSLLSADARKDWLEAAAADFAGRLGIDPPRLTLAAEPPANGFVRNASYDPETGTIALNTDPQASFDRLIDTVAILAHELCHHQQWTMIERLRAGDLAPADPQYKPAAWFYLNNLPGLYQRPADGMDAYLNQPVERHAFMVEAALVGALRPRFPNSALVTGFLERRAAPTPGFRP